MNQKWMKRGAVFGIGAALLLGSGLSAMAGTSGYETYKSAIKQTYAASSLTNQGSIVVTDNGKTIANAKLEVKLNKEKNTLSADIEVTGASGTQTFQAYKQDGKMVFVGGDDADIYRVLPLAEDEQRFHDGDFDPPQHAEQLMEALIGNITDLATVQELPSGGKQTSLHLTGSQIPAIVQAVGSLAAGHMAAADQMMAEGGQNAHMGHGMTGAPSDEMMSMHPSLTDFDIPALTKDVKVEDIRFDAEINKEQYVEHQQGQMIVRGTDEAGQTHELVVKASFDLSGFGQTTPDTVDLSGKQVETIERQEHMPRWHR
ncbi:MAG: hypothetical protein KZY74_14750 [Paenibacillaceae bacterium]|uniref:Copper amine oxidase-like N-terminal domain-containing protein n=1 Tax=Paenibacillus mellifer TaxID=2937794 RepID=A0A9X1XZ49_9BACL|nr:hypothetical protein [Paenibacillus mellifer]MBW4840650.1 hypothetical protein [Paenibacillaceae bacterium]MCK8488385.1 hypothetical protein [Paenibacillus mellifer]